MIINTSPENEAIISNVNNIGEFRIKNSSKAFHILSSGLYENKIRAIIRELSCNAHDSHVAAGKHETPFDVHLPNTFDPWFSIRDYGTGLTHDQVINIYTTYFESTKTNSNEFIGALGLGSKSPFSYTDNFTVIAIKDRIKGIYTAFINAQGVPSIALMTSEESDEPNGVEVKFSVENTSDFTKFCREAEYVYSYFKLMPVVSGNSYFNVIRHQYADVDIIPGVHRLQRSGASIAVMGNIAYPIRVPNAEQNLGPLTNLLNCNLELHFEIGELDFQASREGLSYIPQTIEAIKNKLQSLSDSLVIKLKEEADAIENKWEQALFLTHKQSQNIWVAPARQYVATHQLDLFTDSHLRTFSFKVSELQSKFNIKINKFAYSPGYKQKVTNVKAMSVWDVNISGYIPTYDIRVRDNTHFVINDTKIGASNRAKHHWKNSVNFSGDQIVFVLEPADKTKPILTDAFFMEIYTPPKIYNASDLITPPKKKPVERESDVSIMRLVEGITSRSLYKWVNAGEFEDFDKTKTVYYLPLSSYSPVSEYNLSDGPKLFSEMANCGITRISSIGKLYGVRKTDIKVIEKQPNWVNIEPYIVKVLTSLTDVEIAQLVVNTVDAVDKMLYNANNILKHVSDKDSLYVSFMTPYIGLKRQSIDSYRLRSMLARYNKSVNIDTITAEVDVKIKQMYTKYPLLKSIDKYSAEPADVAWYINTINSTK
jgi:hypothetical protein